MSKLIVKSANAFYIHIDSLFYAPVEVMLCTVKMQSHVLWVSDDMQELCMLNSQLIANH